MVARRLQHVFRRPCIASSCQSSLRWLLTWQQYEISLLSTQSVMATFGNSSILDVLCASQVDSLARLPRSRCRLSARCMAHDAISLGLTPPHLDEVCGFRPSVHARSSKAYRNRSPVLAVGVSLAVPATHASDGVRMLLSSYGLVLGIGVSRIVHCLHVSSAQLFVSIKVAGRGITHPWLHNGAVEVQFVLTVKSN